MKLFPQFFITLCSFGIFHSCFSDLLDSDDAIVIEANFGNPNIETQSDGVTEDGNYETTMSSGQDIPVTTQEFPQAGESIDEFPNEPGNYPWLADIQKDGKHLCTGTLLDNFHVITTAYCVYKLGAKSADDLLKIRVNVGFRTTSKQHATSARVRKIIFHRYFNVTTAFNDIALLQLENVLTFDKNIQPISLQGDTGHINSIAEFEESIIGWKSNSEYNSHSFGEERITRKSRNECRRNYIEVVSPNGISDDMLCAGGDLLSTTCYWSFGSPLVSRQVDDNSGKPVLIGTYSWGIEALLPKCEFYKSDPKPMVFTRLSSYMEWIHKNLKH